jgi:hypothetical protein
MKICQDLESFFPAVFARQPSRAAWEKEETDIKQNSRNGLYAPGDTESLGSLIGIVNTSTSKGSTVLDVILNKDAPSYRPLLERDDASADFFWSNLSLVDWAIEDIRSWKWEGMILDPTYTIEDAIPMLMPAITRPTINIATFWLAHWMLL